MTRRRLRFLTPLLAVALVAAAAACDSDDGGEGLGGEDTGEFPRNETLYVTGKSWDTFSVWSPWPGSDWATGAAGLIYETLFLFNTKTAELEPWLAESGEWVDDTTYEITLREGITWSDETPFTAADVAFSLGLGLEFETSPFSQMTEWVESVVAEGDTTVTVTFSEPRRGEWDNILTRYWIGAEHIWGDQANEDLFTAEASEDQIVGTGSYTHNSHTEERAVLERSDTWWGTDALGLEMKPRYIVDFANSTHNAIAGQELAAGNIDLSNNFLPVETLDDPNIEAYRNEPPYMIAWNTAYLLPNTTRAPMDNAEFRRAMAFAINVQEIVDTAYAGLVEAASPTGLLPTWVDQGMVDEDVVSELGFSYDPAEANRILDEAGYALDGDWRATEDGEPIELTLIVPQGWTDWNIAADIIATNLQEVGLNVLTDFPEAGTVDELRNSGDFDLVVNNWTEISNTPWSNYNYLYQLPIAEVQNPSNFGRYENETAWQLTQQLGALSVSERAENEFDQVHSDLQELTLSEMPAIPLWYNGLWAQWNTTHWTGWPKDPDVALPSTWNQSWQKGAVYMLAQLEPVE